jgi:hypothetical protein
MRAQVERRPSLYDPLYPNLSFLNAERGRETGNREGVQFIDHRYDEETGALIQKFHPAPMPMWLPDDALSCLRAHMEETGQMFLQPGKQVCPTRHIQSC